MNHQAGPETDGADDNVVDSTPVGGAAADSAAAEGAATDSVAGAVPPDAPIGAADTAQSEAGRGEAAAAATGKPADLEAGRAEAGAAATGEPADHEAAAAASEPARLETGEPRVDAALTLLDRLTELPVTEHAAVFEQVHAELTAVLGQLDPESAGADD